MNGLWHRLRGSPEALGGLLGLGLVVFGILAALLVRDLALSSKVCSGGSPQQSIAMVEFQMCRHAVISAERRLVWEAAGLLCTGAILGAGFVAWRRGKR